MAITINHQTNDISATSGSMTIDGASAGASTTFDAVGTYCFAWHSSDGNQNNGGGTYAGSALRRGNSNGRSNSSLSGTWRVMGAIGYNSSGGTNTSTAYSRTVYVRIS